MKEKNFILDFQKPSYPYFEEVNEGIVRQVKSTDQQASILDVGSGRGALGAVLKRLGYQVYAIESNPGIANEARQQVDKCLCADLHDIDKIRCELHGQKFQYIIFSDVLEHTFDPLQVLRSYQEFLAENGKILVSLPNVANWLNRLQFLLGIFNYEMTGVMDRTHVRFFTFHSAKKLLEASAFTIHKVDSTPFITRAILPIIKKIVSKKSDNVKSIIESPYYRFYVKYVYPIEYCFCRLLPGLFAFRIILVASSQRGEKTNDYSC